MKAALWKAISNLYWRREKALAELTPGQRIVERHLRPFCEDEYIVRTRDNEVIGRFNRKADALLDVAAPDLLQALTDLITEIRAYSYPECDQEGEIGAAELKAADAAIAKAKGLIL